MGIGGALVMPATLSILVNTLGTTLGVAVLGSLLSSGFASRFDSTAELLPQEVRELAESSLAGARVASQQVGGSQGEAIFNAAKDAWVHGLQLSMTVGAAIILGAALLTWRLLPSETSVPIDDEAYDHDDTTEGGDAARWTATTSSTSSRRPSASWSRSRSPAP